MKSIVTTFRLNAALLERLDAWAKAQLVPPNRTAIITAALEEFLDRHGGAS